MKKVRGKSRKKVQVKSAGNVQKSREKKQGKKFRKKIREKVWEKV